MPIFDFKCRACGEVFEFMTRGDLVASCPKCSGADLEKLLSNFKVGPPVPTAAQKEQKSLERAGWVKTGQPFKRRY